MKSNYSIRNRYVKDLRDQFPLYFKNENYYMALTNGSNLKYLNEEYINTKNYSISNRSIAIISWINNNITDAYIPNYKVISEAEYNNVKQKISKIIAVENIK